MFTGISDERWRDVYRLVKKVSIGHKIFEMQFKILHRITGPNKLLHKIGKIASPACCLCEMHVETIEHLFYESYVIETFWFNLIDGWNRSHTSSLNINCKSILLHYNVSNSKESIYRYKVEEKQPYMNSF